MKQRIIHILRILSVIPLLGLWNVGYVAWYRFTLITGLRRRYFPVEKWVGTNYPGRKEATGWVVGFFTTADPVEDYPAEWADSLVGRIAELRRGELNWFFYHKEMTGDPPDWFRNPFDRTHLENPYKHWTRLGTFDLPTGDIKILWEPSRFYWLTDLARSYRVSGDERTLAQMNRWVTDWAYKNPLNRGPNWKCGQEASIRLFSLLMAAWILGQHTRPSKALHELIRRHLSHIYKNRLYAKAQDNNHGTSEAAALMIGGAFLKENQTSGDPDPLPGRYYEQGRKLLENRVKRLVSRHGSFSQHSVNYQRVLIDTLTLAEFWREAWNLDRFSMKFYRKAHNAIDWLEQMTDPVSGRAPNLGNNDGARIQNLHGAGYEDMRPSIQAARAVYSHFRRYGDGPWDEPLYWMKRLRPEMKLNPVRWKNRVLDNSYVVLNGSQNSWGMLRLPNFRFRPAQNDLFHFDFWHEGRNIFCDAGTGSYYEPEREDFRSVRAHNTVAFDGQEPMPSAGRFLVAGWPDPVADGSFTDKKGQASWEGCYRDSRGNRHRRKVTFSGNRWLIRDSLAGPYRFAHLRWHLPFDESLVKVSGNRVSIHGLEIEIESGEYVKVSKSMHAPFYNGVKDAVELTVRFDFTRTLTTIITLPDRS